MKLTTPKRQKPNTPMAKTAKRRAPNDADSSDVTIKRMPPKSVSMLRVRYVNVGKGLPRAYRLDE